MTPSMTMHSLRRRMVAGLQPGQETAAAHPDAGGLHCPFHSCFHSRCGETLFPKVYLGLARQDTLAVEKRLQVAERLVRRQSPDGIWLEMSVEADRCDRADAGALCPE
jgi:hypothetical protein